MKNRILSILLLCLVMTSASAQKIRVACIGNSITYGHGIEDREQNSYPAQLQQLLGEEYDVRNFGVSGTTAQKEGDSPWINTPQYKETKEFLPQIAVIKLGTNDSKPQNWVNAERLINSLESLALEIEALPSHPHIIMALPAKAYEVRWGIRDSIIYHYEIPAIRQLAQKHHWQLIDLYKATSKMPAFFPDGIHPDQQGANIIAKKVRKAVIKEKKRL